MGIELTQVTPITQADAEVVVTADAEVVTEAKVIEAPEAPKSRTEHVGEVNDASLTLGQRVSAHGYQSGVIMYIGELNSMPSMKGVRSILLCFRHSTCSAARTMMQNNTT